MTPDGNVRPAATRIDDANHGGGAGSAEEVGDQPDDNGAPPPGAAVGKGFEGEAQPPLASRNVDTLRRLAHET